MTFAEGKYDAEIWGKYSSHMTVQAREMFLHFCRLVLPFMFAASVTTIFSASAEPAISSS